MRRNHFLKSMFFAQIVVSTYIRLDTDKEKFILYVGKTIFKIRIQNHRFVFLFLYCQIIIYYIFIVFNAFYQFCVLDICIQRDLHQPSSAVRHVKDQHKRPCKPNELLPLDDVEYYFHTVKKYESLHAKSYNFVEQVNQQIQKEQGIISKDEKISAHVKQSKQWMHLEAKFQRSKVKQSGRLGLKLKETIDY